MRYLVLQPVYPGTRSPFRHTKYAAATAAITVSRTDALPIG